LHGLNEEPHPYAVAADSEVRAAFIRRPERTKAERSTTLDGAIAGGINLSTRPSRQHFPFAQTPFRLYTAHIPFLMETDMATLNIKKLDVHALLALRAQIDTRLG
jgi:hypothetical protein